MSPGNSYFKTEEIKYLLKTSIDRFGRVLIMIADVPAISTYISFGYAENIARRVKAIPQGNLLKNKVKKAMTELGLSNEQVRILEWDEEVEKNTEYQKIYHDVKSLYDTNDEFQKSADNTTKEVLVASKREFQDLEKSIKTAVHYLLSEFAFLEWAPKFLNTEKVIYIYHKNWPVYENYISGKFDGNTREYLDFLLVENPWETYNPIWGLEENFTNKDLKKVLRVGISNYPPAFMYDKQLESFSGIFFEILTKIANSHGWEIIFTEETGYGVIIDGLNEKRFDVFGSTVWPTPERKTQATFSKSIYTSKVFAWVKENSILENNNQRIVIKENDISDSIAKSDFPNNRLVYVPQLADPMELLNFVAWH